MAQDLAIGVTALIALVVRTNLGFGFSLVFVPVGSLALGFDTAFKAAVVLELVVGLILAVEFRRDLRWLEAVELKIWSVLGLAVGIASRPFVPTSIVVSSSMGIVLLACWWLVARRDRFELVPSSRARGAAGALSGFLNFWTSLAGPPVVIYYLATEQRTDGVRGALTGYFLILYMFTLAALVGTGRYSGFAGWDGIVVAAAVVLAGYPAVRTLAMRSRRDITRPSLVLLMITAGVVIVRQLI